MKIGFDSEKYLKEQSEAILARAGRFDGKLYLEFGGKLICDYHAARVLPGLPFVGILYGGIQMIFAFKSPSWKPGLVIFVLWLISLVVLGVGLFAGFATVDCIDSIETLFT